MADNGWDKWGAHVLEEMKRTNSNIDAIRKDQCKMGKNIAKLEVKTGFWGALGGALVTIPTLIVFYLKGE